MGLLILKGRKLLGLLPLASARNVEGKHLVEEERICLEHLWPYRRGCAPLRDRDPSYSSHSC
jgi:hypothetical protein